MSAQLMLAFLLFSISIGITREQETLHCLGYQADMDLRQHCLLSLVTLLALSSYWRVQVLA